jgi:hypothetical protein
MLHVTDFLVFMQDEVDLHVVPLEGIRIWTPLKRIQTNTKVVFVLPLDHL